MRNLEAKLLTANSMATLIIPMDPGVNTFSLVEVTISGYAPAFPEDRFSLVTLYHLRGKQNDYGAGRLYNQPYTTGDGDNWSTTIDNSPTGFLIGANSVNDRTVLWTVTIEMITVKGPPS